MELNGIPDLCDGPCHHQRVKPTTAGGVAMLLEFFFGNQGSSRAGIIASSVVAIVVAAAVATAIGLPPTSCKYREALQIDTERVARPYSPKDR